MQRGAAAISEDMACRAGRMARCGVSGRRQAVRIPCGGAPWVRRLRRRELIGSRVRVWPSRDAAAAASRNGHITAAEEFTAQASASAEGRGAVAVADVAIVPASRLTVVSGGTACLGSGVCRDAAGVRVSDYGGPAGGSSDSEGGDAPHVGIEGQRRCWLRSCRRRRRQDGEFGPDGQAAPHEWSWRWRCRVGHGRPGVYVCKRQAPRAGRLTIHSKVLTARPLQCPITILRAGRLAVLSAARLNWGVRLESYRLRVRM
jgi:hypothetical protein